MDVFARLAAAAIVPAAVLDDAKNAVPTANALLQGGIDVLEITLRTDAAIDAIASVSSQCPDTLVGAGSVLSLEQCRSAIQAGAKFIISPGFDREIVDWCMENNIPVIPGCITPTEIMEAMKLGLRVLKFFPASVYGGLAGLKALSAPFAGVKFIPTGGIDAQNLGDYLCASFVHAVGGSWVCPQADIAAGSFEKITQLAMQARQAALGFEVAHIGINCGSSAESLDVCTKFQDAFALPIKVGNSSNFVTSGIEVMKSVFPGKNGHIAIRTNSVSLAMAALEKAGYVCDPNTAKYKAGRVNAIYLTDEFGGFAVHLLQR